MIDFSGYNKPQLVRAARALGWKGDEARTPRAEIVAELKRRDGDAVARALVTESGAPPPSVQSDEAAARPGANGSDGKGLQGRNDSNPFTEAMLPAAPQPAARWPNSQRALEERNRAALAGWQPPEAREPLVALDVRELLTRDFTPAEAMLPPWLRRQTLAMVHAARGVGKTHFALGVAYAVATGGAFLGWKAEKPWRVLYIDGEMPGSTIKERVEPIVRSAGHEPADGFLRIFTPDTQPRRGLPDLATAAGQEEFNALLDDADLIVVDNLSCLVRSGPENEGESWLPISDWALARRREGRAVMFIHHSGKNGTQRGSSRREDVLDVVINLRRPADYAPEKGAQFEVRFEKSRGFFGADARPIEATLTSQDGAHAWSWKEADTANHVRMVELAKLGMSQTDIAEEVGVNKSTVSRALAKARAAGELPKEPPHG